MRRFRERAPRPEVVSVITEIAVDAKDEETAPVLRHAIPDGIEQLDKDLITGSSHPCLDVVEHARACLRSTATAGPMDSLHVLQEEDARLEADDVVQEHIDQVVCGLELCHEFRLALEKPWQGGPPIRMSAPPDRRVIH